MVNRIVLVGRLTRDPELRYTPNGVPVAQFRIAVDRPFRNARGERETDFINVVAWRQSAEFVHQYLSKGRLVGVDGRLQIRSYTTQDGQQRTVAEVVADRVAALDRPREELGEAPPPPSPEEPSEPEPEPAVPELTSGRVSTFEDEFDEFDEDPFADQ